MILNLLRDAYEIAEKFSITGLALASVIFLLTFMFAIREAASWFFKIDDLRTELIKLSEIVFELETGIQLLREEQVKINKSTTNPPATKLVDGPPINSAMNLTGAPSAASAAEANAPGEKKISTSFPLTH